MKNSNQSILKPVVNSLSAFFIILLTIPHCAFSQAPEVEWEHLFCDGTSMVFELTDDGGVIAVSNGSTGIDCEKSEIGQGGADYWVIKMDADFNILWQNVIGGSGDDFPSSIKKTLDGGYIIGGVSNSPVSGDKTEPRQDLTYPFSDDIWIVKIDAFGNLMWQNTIGGNYGEYGVYIEQTTSGGYILSASSNSPISGDKMEAQVGGTYNYDYWIIKLNNLGNIVWQNTIGGTGDDYVKSIHQTIENGYIVCGHSNSGISGDKTESYPGPSSNNDYWIIKLSPSGTIHWQNTIGTTYHENSADIIPMPDGTYIIGGYANDDFDNQYQITKISNAGDVIWDNSIGCGGDVLRSIGATSDGGFILGGRSNAYICDEKSDLGPPNTYGWDGYNMWVVKVDSLGNYEWDNAIGTADDDGGAFVREMADGGFLVGGYVGYDDGLYDNSLGWSGAWLAKLYDTPCLPTVELCNSLDDNCNGLIDDDVLESITVSAGGATTFCSGGSVLLSVDSYTGTTLQWKKNGEDIAGATSSAYLANANGTYTCQTTSACSFAISSWLVVTVNKNPPATITAGGATTFCAGGSVVLTANTGAGLSYQWYKGASLLVGATSINYTATIAENYKCRVTKTATGCFKNSNTISVSVPCKESLENLNPEIHIYPNPASEKITINIDNKFKLGSITITDISGKKIIQHELKSAISEFEISSLMSGLYFINFNIDGITSTQKFIKQ